MRALDRQVLDAVWSAVEPLLPAPPPAEHPLGCHRPRAADRNCVEVMIIRLATGCSWVDAERLAGNVVSDTTVWGRRDEWMAAGVFDALVTQALAAYDRIIGFDLSECAADASTHKAPCGGEATGRNPTDRGKLGWKWSLFTERNGIPLGWAAEAANRHDWVLFEPTLASVAARGLHLDTETLHLDRGYDTGAARSLAHSFGIFDVVCAKKRKHSTAHARQRVPLGMRWPVERTNAWLANFGQLRRNTDRRGAHRLAQLALAVAFLVTAKLIDWRDRWSPRDAYPR